MPTLTNYPYGFPNGVTLRNVPILGMHSSSRVFWVDSVSGADGNKGTHRAPFATLNYAVTQCVASRGDKIVLKSGHAENVAAAGAIAINIAGIEIIGLGDGNERPTFTFITSTAATITISAAGVTLRNCVFICGVDQVVSPIVISAANCTLDSIELQDSATNKEFVAGILTTAAADKLKIKLRYMGQTGGSHCATPIKLVGCDEGLIDVEFYGKASTAVVNFATTACTGVRITGSMYNSGTTTGAKNVVDSVGGSTWWADIFDGAAGKRMDGGSGSSLSFSDASMGEQVSFKAAQLLVNGTTLFTIAGGPIIVKALAMICTVSSDATAATVQFSSTPTSGSAQTFSGASSSVANSAAGASITLAGTALATAALLNANGANLMANPGTIFVPAGTITMVIGSGPTTTGTWATYMRWAPMAAGVSVS